MSRVAWNQKNPNVPGMHRVSFPSWFRKKEGQSQTNMTLNSEEFYTANEGTNVPAGLAAPFLPNGLDQIFRSLQTLGFNRKMADQMPVDMRQQLRNYEVMQLMAKQGKPAEGTSTFGKIFLDENFWKFLEVRRSVEEEMKYKLFLYQQMHLAKPEQRAAWKKQFPNMWRNFKEGNKETKKVMDRLIGIQLNGMQSEEDYRFIYAFRTGVFDFPVAKDKKRIPKTVAFKPQNEMNDRAMNVRPDRTEADHANFPIAESDDLFEDGPQAPAVENNGEPDFSGDAN